MNLLEGKLLAEGQRIGVVAAPRQTTASYLPLSTIFLATKGISNAPGTQARSSLFSSPP